MAAPPSKTARSLAGRWRLNQTLSEPQDKFLALEGVAWAARKAAPYVTVTMTLKEYKEEAVPYVEVHQTATMGYKLSSENRAMDWSWQERDDAVVGPVRNRARYIDGLDGISSPDQHLRHGWIEDDHVEIELVSDARGFTAVQLWGFGEVYGERHLVIRAVVTKGNASATMHLVYDWIGE